MCIYSLTLICLILPLDSTILLIDIGNTTIKWCFDGQFQSESVSTFSVNQLPKTQSIFASCVGDKSLLKGLDEVAFVKSPSEFGDFKSSYQTPSDLGADRFLAMIAATAHYPNQTLLVIDAGSALTFDLILPSGAHKGGLIMPGLGKLRSSFNQFNTNSQQLKSQQLADNTEQAWLFGTGQMFIDSIEAQIQRYLEVFGDLRIVLTGGDSKLVMLKLNHVIRHHPNLVLEGLSIYVQNTHSTSPERKV